MNKKTTRLLLIVLATALIGISLTFIFYYGYYFYDYQKMDVIYAVEARTVGVDAGVDFLRLGIIPAGGRGYRGTVITAEHDTRLVISFSGAAGKYMSAQPNPMFLHAGESADVTISARPPEYATHGNYSGTVHFKFYRTTFK